MNALCGGTARLRRHCCNPVADETDLVPAKNRHVANLFTDKKTFDIGAGDDRAYARNFFGPRNINAPNARMRMWAAQNLRPQQAGKFHVGGINSLPAHFSAAFAARHRGAYNFVISHGVYPLRVLVRRPYGPRETARLIISPPRRSLRLAAQRNDGSAP